MTDLNVQVLFEATCAIPRAERGGDVERSRRTVEVFQAINGSFVSRTLAIAALLLVGCGANSFPCKQDSDCVPTQCCHATTCVANAPAPACVAACTLECTGRVDSTCGGRCVCSLDHCVMAARTE